MPTPFDFIRQQALKAGSKALREVLSGARQIPEELGAATGIVRNALSNVSEIPVQAAEALRLGPATSRITREAYGGSGATRGGLLGTLERTPVPRRAPVPAWTGKAAESASGYPRPRPTPGGALVPTRTPSVPSTASRDLASDQFARYLEAPVGTVGPSIPPSPPSSVNPNYYPSSVNPNYVPSSVNPNYFPSSVNKNYFPDPEFRSIDPYSAIQPRLDLRAPGGAEAFRPYTTSKGALRPEGTKVGGQYYRPGIMVKDNVVTVGPRGEGGSFRADVGTQDVIRGSLEAAQATPTPGMVRTPAGQMEMFSPTGAVMFPRSVGSSPSAPVRASIGNVTPLPGRGVALDPSVDDVVVRNPVRPSIGNVAPLPGRGVALDPSVDDVVSRTVAAVRSPGLKFVNLNDPTLQRLLLGGLGVGSIATGITAMQSEGERKRTKGQMPMTNVEETTPSAASLDQLQAEQAGIDMGRALAARLFTDESGRPLAESGNGGASEARNRREATRAAVQQGGDRAAAAVARAMEPRDPSSYKSAADYFAAEREYAQQQGMRGLMRQAGEQLAQRMQTEAQLGAWAEANPHLMYRLQQQQLANDAMNQQTGMNFKSETVNAAMGSNTGNNAAGYGESQTEAELGNPQAYDIAQATAPLVQPTLENLPTAIQQRLQEEALRRRSAGLF